MVVLSVRGGNTAAKNRAGFIGAAESRELLGGHEESRHVRRDVARELGELRQAGFVLRLLYRVPSPGCSEGTYRRGHRRAWLRFFRGGSS